MELKKRGDVWTVVFYVNGDRKRVSTGKRDHNEAQLKALEIVREHLADGIPEADKRRMAGLETMGDLLRAAWNNHWQYQDSAKHLKCRYQKCLREFGHLTLAMVTHDRVQSTINAMTKGKGKGPLSKATKNRYASLLSMAFELRQRNDRNLVIPNLPRWDESDNIVERYLSVEEEAKILHWFDQNTAPSNTRRQYLRDLFVLLIDTGMRCSEATEIMTAERLKVSASGTVVVQLPHGSTKTGNGRIVPLTPRAAEAAKRLVASPLHGTLTSAKLTKPMGYAMRKGCGLTDISQPLHILRHTCGTRLMNWKNGDDQRNREYDVMTWLGHTNIQTTKRYAKLADDTLDSALSALTRNPLANPSTDPTPHAARESHPPVSDTVSRPKLRVIK